jgi:uncharacterized protein
MQEGKENLARCLQATFAAALAHRVGKVVIFTSAGRGVMMALDEYRSQEKYSHIELVAVSFPSQSQFTAGDPLEHCIPGSVLETLSERGVPVVRAHLPFDPIRTHYVGQGVLGQDFGLIGNALRIFGGSMSLCVQAVLMASDAGFVELGEHVIAMTSDTSILVRAAGTSRGKRVGLAVQLVRVPRACRTRGDSGRSPTGPSRACSRAAVASHRTCAAPADSRQTARSRARASRSDSRHCRDGRRSRWLPCP